MIKYTLSIDAVCDECGQHLDGFDVYQQPITGTTIGDYSDQIKGLWDRTTVDGEQLCDRCAEGDDE